MNKLASVIATWFGCGLAPFAPGTVGSLGGLAVAIVLHHYWGWFGPQFGWLAVAAVLPAVWAAGAVAESSGEKDPGRVVVDEVIGQWVALSGVTSLNWKGWLGAFLLFRAFDIWKPPPVRQLERLPGGTGIVADDVMAGFYAALVLFAAGWFNLY